MSSKIDEAYPGTPTTSPRSSTCPNESKLNIDLPCVDGEEANSSNLSARSRKTPRADHGCGDVSMQTRKDTGSSPEYSFSFSNMDSPTNKNEVVDCNKNKSTVVLSRNPITGLGLGEDGVGGIKPRKPKTIRDGNPVTGEGYKVVNDIHNQSVSVVTGNHQAVNKNRIPPGGYSSGLW